MMKIARIVRTAGLLKPANASAGVTRRESASVTSVSRATRSARIRVAMSRTAAIVMTANRKTAEGGMTRRL